MMNIASRRRTSKTKTVITRGSVRPVVCVSLFVVGLSACDAYPSEEVPNVTSVIDGSPCDVIVPKRVGGIGLVTVSGVFTGTGDRTIFHQHTGFASLLRKHCVSYFV